MWLCFHAERDRREYMKWTPEEEQHFFTVLRACAGQKPEHIISQTCNVIGTKDYKQASIVFCLDVSIVNPVTKCCDVGNFAAGPRLLLQDGQEAQHAIGRGAQT